MFTELADGSPVTAPVQIMPLHLAPFPCLQAIASVTSISFHLGHGEKSPAERI